MAAVGGEVEAGEKVVETTVKLVSMEGHTFIVHKKAAIISQTIKSMIEEGLDHLFLSISITLLTIR
jgi:hypothetical protein